MWEGGGWRLTCLIGRQEEGWGFIASQGQGLFGSKPTEAKRIGEVGAGILGTFENIGRGIFPFIPRSNNNGQPLPPSLFPPSSSTVSFSLPPLCFLSLSSFLAAWLQLTSTLQVPWRYRHVQWGEGCSRSRAHCRIGDCIEIMSSLPCLPSAAARQLGRCLQLLQDSRKPLTVARISKLDACWGSAQDFPSPARYRARS